MISSRSTSPSKVEESSRRFSSHGKTMFNSVFSTVVSVRFLFGLVLGIGIVISCLWLEDTAFFFGSSNQQRTLTIPAPHHPLLVFESASKSNLTVTNHSSNVNQTLLSALLRERAAGSKRSKTVIVSSCIPLRRFQFVEIAEFNHLLYSATHGYQYVSNHRHHVYNFSDSPQLSMDTEQYKAHWSKPALIKKVLQDEQVDTLFWMDCDAMFMKCQQSMAQLFQRATNYYFGDGGPGQNNTKAWEGQGRRRQFDMLLSAAPQTLINSGIIAMRNTPYVRAFVDNWYKLSVAIGTPEFKRYYTFHDQATLVMTLLGADASNYQPLHQMTNYTVVEIASQYQRNVTGLALRSDRARIMHFRRAHLSKKVQEKIAIMPAVFMNSNRRTFRDGHFIVHFPGSPKQKFANMKMFRGKSNCMNQFLESTELNM